MIIKYNNKIVSHGNRWLSTKLPDNTLLFKFEKSSYDPSSLTTLTGATWTRVSAEPNIWLWDARSVETTWWCEAFRGKFNSYDSSGYVDIIGAGELTIPTVIGVQNGKDYPGMFRNNGTTLRNVCYLSFHNVELAQCLFQNNSRLLRIEGLNLPKATIFQSMFKNCSKLLSIGSITSSKNLTNVSEMLYNAFVLLEAPYFETSGVTNMKSFLYRCNSIKSIPLYHTDSVTNVNTAFAGCFLVESGALAMYQQLSSLANTPAHNTTFSNCGRDTTTGAAELAQIPTSWGGTMA